MVSSVLPGTALKTTDHVLFSSSVVEALLGCYETRVMISGLLTQGVKILLWK